MYIQPNSTIKLYKNVPLDTTYEHTLWFDNVSAQNNYFHNNSSILLQTFDGQTYQRVVKGEMTLGVNAESIYTCNYLAFRNTAFGSKWFYAFVTSVEYVSNTASKLTFEIDVMQTYLFDVTLKESFVEREHSTTDNAGDNILPENVDCGEYVFEGYGAALNVIGNDTVIIVSYVDSSSHGTLIDGVYSGVKKRAFNCNNTGIDNLNTFLDTFLETPDNIVSMYMCPKTIVPTASDEGTTLSYGSSGITTRIDLGAMDDSATFGSYTPKNKKMYTYPFNYVTIDNANGNTLQLRYEFFNDSHVTLSFESCIAEPVQIVCRPYGYKGTSSGGGISEPQTLNTESISLQSFPECSWNNDTFKAWLAQNTIPIGLNTLGMLTSQGLTPTTMNTSGVFNLMTSAYTASIATDVVRGSYQTGNANFGNNKQRFYGARTRITENYARSIDAFFSKYGYATRKLKVPNRNARKQWTYCKTNGCIVIGNAPADDVRRICEIYDKGITFWKNASNVGNYELDNSPI